MVNSPPLAETASFSIQALKIALPQVVQNQLKNLLLEGLSWMIMGTRRDEGRRLISPWRGSHGGTGSVAGCPDHVPFVEAARLNASLSQVYDCNDGRRMAWLQGGLWHPGRYVIPTAIALAEHYRLSGDDLLRLMALGYDVGGKIQYPDNSMAGAWAVASMTAAASGATMDSARRALVLGHFSYPNQPRWPDDWDLNHVKYGLIVRAGMQAALMAGESSCLPEEQCRVTLREPYYWKNPHDLDGHESLKLYVKPYNACRALHGVITLALHARKNHGVRPENIERVEFILGDVEPAQLNPYRANTHFKYAQFSVPYVAACAFVDGSIDVDQFDQAHLVSPQIHALQSRISSVIDEKHCAKTAVWNEPSSVKIFLRDGEMLENSLIATPGSSRNPLSDEERAAKFKRWTEGALTTSAQQKAIELVERIDALNSVDSLAELLRGVKVAT